MPADDVWVCCQCSVSNTTTLHGSCHCGHTKCASCSTGRPGLAENLIWPNTTEITPRYIPTTSFVDDLGVDKSSSNGNYTYGAYTAQSPGSDMSNWWVCHECRQTNNPALAPERCSNCEHSRCISCTTL